MTGGKPDLPIYRMVEGKRVRIPARDPNRRYSSVSNVQTGEQYVLEYTDEEENQADAQAKQWLADAPKHAAEQAEQAKRTTEFRASLVYESRVVAFVDILGWRQAIERSANDKDTARELGISLDMSLGVGRYAGQLAGMAKEGKWPGDPQVTHFSDSVLISVTADRFAEGHLTHFLRAIVSSLLRRGLLVRGGVAVGPLIHRSAMAYGPALNRAYDLEHKVAVLPRIILDDTLAAAWGAGVVVSDRDGNHIGRMCEWRKDTDGHYFLDFLQPFPIMPGVDHGERFWRAHLEPVREMIWRQLTESRDVAIKAKYEWAAFYFNTFCDEHAKYVSRIPIPDR